MLRFWVLLIYLTEIKLCIKLVLYFFSKAAFTHAGQLCSQMLETLDQVEVGGENFLL